MYIDMNRLLKFIAVVFVLFGSGYSVLYNNLIYASDISNYSMFSDIEKGIITQNGMLEFDEKLSNVSQKLSEYFTLSEDGRVLFNATKEDLIQDLGITQEEAEELLNIAKLEPKLYERNNKFRGFVGIRLHLGPQVRAMNGWAAGAFAGGFVGWYCKELAASGPWGAGAAALITASTAATVKWAVENGVRVVPIGQNIPGFNLAFDVNVP